MADSQRARPSLIHSNNPQVFNNCGKSGPEKGEAKIAQTGVWGVGSGEWGVGVGILGSWESEIDEGICVRHLRHPTPDTRDPTPHSPPAEYHATTSRSAP